MNHEDAPGVGVLLTATGLQQSVRLTRGIVITAVAEATSEHCALFHLLSDPHRASAGKILEPEMAGHLGIEHLKAHSLEGIFKIIMAIEITMIFKTIMDIKILTITEAGQGHPIVMVVETDRTFQETVPLIFGAKILIEMWIIGIEIKTDHIIIVIAVRAASTGTPIIKIDFTVKAEV